MLANIIKTYNKYFEIGDYELSFSSRLDPALIRPGRVDLKEYIGYCSYEQCKQMFSRFYPGESTDLAEKFATTAVNTSQSISPAALQGYFLKYKHSPENALKEIKSLLL